MFTPRRKPAVLVVDDDPLLLDLVTICLEGEFAVTAVRSGADGLGEFDRQAFDIVIADRAMPEMPGAVFAAKLKERAPGLPIILISGFKGDPAERELFSAFLPKPFTKRQLVATLNEALAA